MKKTKPKPLATFGKIELHQASFHPFESTKYLNINALKKASSAKVELGSIEAGGIEATLVAIIQNGRITGMAPATCRGCAEKSNTKPKAKKSAPGPALKKSVNAALAYMKEKGFNPVKLPNPVTSKAFLEIQIGPVIIEFWPPNLCIVIDEPDGTWCTYCLWGPKLCGGLGKL